MLNKIKINFESGATIFFFQGIFIIIGTICVFYVFGAIYNDYILINENIARLLDLKSRVVVESINFNKIEFAQQRLIEDPEGHEQDNYKNPFVYKK